MGEALSAPRGEGSGYRPVSGLAVAAVMGGMLSAAALVNPFFWVVPLLAVGLACLALVDIGRPGAEKAGRLLAVAGLALAVGFGAQAVSATATARWIAASRAVAAAGAWVAALREGRLADARGMCAPEAVPEIEEIAGRVEGCGGEPSLEAAGSTADGFSGSWQVRATFAACAAGAIAYDIHLMPSTMMRQGRAVERWMVLKCEPSHGLEGSSTAH